MMRIITGKAKGVKLLTLEGNNTRPTTERAKEAIFSMLQFDIEGRRVLDLFAGSGQMGLEALSRGAESAVLVDHSKAALEIVRQNVSKTRLNGAETVYADALEYLRRTRQKKEKFDIVFLDPPYDEKILPKALTLLIEGEWLKSTSIVVCESRDNADVFLENTVLNEKYDVIKSARHGISCINLLIPKREESAQDYEERKN